MTDTIVKLRADMQAALSSAEAISKAFEGQEMPEEKSVEMTAFLGKFDTLKARLDFENRLSEADEYLNDPAGEPKSAQVSWREAAPTEGDEEIDEKAWREIKVNGVNVRYHVPIAVQAKGYKGSFEGYMRKGMNDLSTRDRKTLTEGVDTAGGFLVPEDYQTELIRKIAAQATIRALARVASTSRDIAKWPKVKYTADDKYTSGVRIKWTGEVPSSSSTHRVTDPEFGLYSIPVHTAMASMPLSNDLIEDSAFDIMGISSDMLAEAFVLGENDAFLNGSGVGRPMGILTQVDGDGPASVNMGSASTVTADGVIDLVYALASQYERNARVIMSKSTEKVIRKLQDSDGNYIWPIYPQVGGFGANPKELLGFPTLRDEWMPAIAADAYAMLFGDLKGYLILDRVGLSVQRLSELYAETNITLLLARKRMGGQTVEPWRMKVGKIAE